MNKYRAKRTIVDNKSFHSKKEANRYVQLRTLESVGAISLLECQPRIPLLVNGKKIGVYVGDFRYVEHNVIVIEDVKSVATKTPLYRLKKAILETYTPPIVIRET
jgi:hypothetical protein